MNTRSLVFRLIVWYAGLLSVVFALVGAISLLGLEQYLESNLQSTLARRLLQAQDIVTRAATGKNAINVIRTEMEDRLTPEFSSRFVRVTQPNGAELYRSGTPIDHSFDAKSIASLPSDVASNYKITSTGKHMQISVGRVATAQGIYTVEVGASLDQIRAAEDHLLTLALLMLPVLVSASVGGGYFLVNRALRPVENIAVHAEQITYHNLSERLPVARTGDELERLSISLNHMIARLDEAFQNSRRFLADASHELRTPLTIIKGELEQLALQRRYHDAGAKEEHNRIGSVLEEVQRLIIIVEGLFALSRLDAGEAQREWVRFDLAELVTITTEQMKLLAEDAQLQVICETSPAVFVDGDRSRLKQVIVNLIDNAIKYTPAGGTIRLLVTEADKHAILQVIDTGIGIPEHALPLVFERFFRVDKARSRGGAGLGLAIAKSICIANGGAIEVEAKLGAGSCFTIKFPLAPTAVPIELAITDQKRQPVEGSSKHHNGALMDSHVTALTRGI